MPEWNTKLSLVVGCFILIILGVVFVDTIADNIEERTTIRSITNEEFTLSNTTASVLNYPDIVVNSLSVAINATNVGITNFTLDYTAGSILLKGSNNVSWNGIVANTTYRYYPTDYVKDSPARTILGLVTLLFVLGLVAGTIYYVRKQGAF